MISKERTDGPEVQDDRRNTGGNLDFGANAVLFRRVPKGRSEQVAQLSRHSAGQNDGKKHHGAQRNQVQKQLPK